MTSWESSISAEVLACHRVGGRVTLTLTRPDQLNSFDTALQDAMRAAVDGAAADDSVRCLVITGRGRAFSAGADLGIDPDSDARLAPRTEQELRTRYNPIIRSIRAMPKPVVAAVNGPAIGVGCAIAMACDHVVAARRASFSLAFANVGLTLDAGASLLLGARVGFGRASRMALLSESVDASTALEWGMVDAVVSDDDLDAHVDAVAEKLALGPTQAYAATKRSLNAALLPHLDAAFEVEVQGQTELVDSPDFREGVRAFTGRRRPVFYGR
ncbi:enoyl-CoA hydratase [Gordonia soli]|uniref:Putative enoyl-CoA hydratase n=1 Tax=Gordonia soli NBRC 108243 TaxID=1223545 RepID=M0QJ95_9ACTN|nr:enoyl-CoA hydratase [Gordonia soli]GAC68519.1 putative enoyl-CoA hydratase [Gordonia soli NBRC 108243]